MARLKAFIKEKLTLPLFLSSGDLIRLKSPMMTQGPEIDGGMERSSSRKAGDKRWSEGA